MKPSEREVSPFQALAKNYGVSEAQVLLRWRIQNGYPRARTRSASARTPTSSPSASTLRTGMPSPNWIVAMVSRGLWVSRRRPGRCRASQCRSVIGVERRDGRLRRQQRVRPARRTRSSTSWPSFASEFGCPRIETRGRTSCVARPAGTRVAGPEGSARGRSCRDMASGARKMNC